MAPGESIRDYRIVRRLGEGGMSIVFLAESKETGAQVVLKQLQERHIFNRQFVDRFVQSAHIMRDLRHPHIARAIDCFEIDGKYYVVEEYLQGGSLSDLLENKVPIEERQALLWCRDVLLGINYAHESGVIHRDLKPGNLMLTENREVKITDFGIARAFGGPRLTETGIEMGTPAYMSPEQIQSPHEVDQRTDVYSMGIVLYELLTGDVPFDGTNDYSIKEKVVHRKPRPPRQINAAISPQVEGVILKALKKRPEDRYDGCHQFAVKIEEILKGKPPERKKWLPLAIGAGLAILLVSAFLLFGNRNSKDQGVAKPAVKVTPVEKKQTQPQAIEVSVGITPEAATLGVSEKKIFTAAVTGPSDTTVRWSLMPELGSIAADGTYTAPPSISVQQVVSVVAASTVEPSKSAEAKVTLTPVTLKLSHTRLELKPGEKVQLSVSVEGTSNKAVGWSSKFGSISADGLYVAPAMPPADAQFYITATSKADLKKSASIRVTIKPGVSVKLDPTEVTLSASQQQVFVATVAGSTDKTVTWTVEGKPGMMKDGIFIAPRTATKRVITITATSNEDPSKSDSARVTLIPVSIDLNPNQVTLEAGQQQKFEAIVEGHSNTNVSWSVSGSGLGTIDKYGTYVAPASIPREQAATVRAVSQADTEKVAMASVRLIPKPTLPERGPVLRPNETEQVCIFEHVQYGGGSRCFNPGQQLSDLGTLGNAISSIRAYGGARAAVYDGRSFGGNTAEFDGDIPDLKSRMIDRNKSWNDQIESLRVFPRVGVCVFEKAKFQGKADCWQPGQDQTDLSRSTVGNDEISSIKVFGPTVVTVFIDINFQNQGHPVTSDIPDLKDIKRGLQTWDNQISSIKLTRVNSRD